MAGNYTIVEAQLNIAGGIAGHDLLVMKDPNGVVVQELDGLAHGADGSIKPIGYLPSDTLKVDTFNQATYYSDSEHQAVVASGTQDQIQNMWNAAKTCAADINAENLKYPFMGMGANSNSVASTLDACMGQTEPTIPGSALIKPGVGDLVLPKATIQGVQQQFGLPSTDISADSAVSGENGNTVLVQNADGTTAADTIGTDSSGDGTSDFQDYTSTGAIQWEETLVENSAGAVAAYLYGAGEAVTEAANAVVSVYASSDAIYANGDSATDYVYGSNDITTMNDNYDVSDIYGSADYAYAYGYGDSYGYYS